MTLAGGYTIKAFRVSASEGSVLGTMDFAAIGDHARLPWRFFARLHAAAGSLIAAA